MIKIYDADEELKNVECYQISMCPIALTHTVGAPVGFYPTSKGDREVARWLTRKTLKVFSKYDLTALGYDDVTFRFQADSEEEAKWLHKVIRRGMVKYWDPTKDTDWSDDCVEVSKVIFDATGEFEDQINF